MGRGAIRSGASSPGAVPVTRWALAFGRVRWPQLVARERAVAILVEGGEGATCIRDLLRGEGAIAILVERANERRQGARCVPRTFRTGWTPGLIRLRGVGLFTLLREA